MAEKKAPVVEADVKVEPVVEAPKAEEKPAEKMVTIELEYAMNTNGEVHGPGKVTVSETLAEDLLRRDKEYLQYEAGLHKRRENLIKAGEVR